MCELARETAVAMSLLVRDTPCPSCGYNLRGLEEQHRCPECGFRYDLRDRVVSDVPHANRMSVFDKACAVLALLFGLILLGVGAFGMILGVRLWVDLPPVLGVLPALAGWGVYRTFRIAWRADRAARLERTAPARIPSIYRDPIPTGPVEALDREVAPHIDEPPEEASADAHPL
jgi:hypothetical protein